MSKNFKSLTYIVDEHLTDTLSWLCNHQDTFDSFIYNALTQKLAVQHANGTDIIRVGDYLNASYGILLTAHNFAE